MSGSQRAAVKGVWFVVGSQVLYGPKVLDVVAARGQEMAAYIDASGTMPCKFIL